MGEIKDPVEAETRAKKFIAEKHRNAKQIFFSKTSRQENSWLMEGNVWFKKYFFTVKKSFTLRISAETGQVTSYEEKSAQRGKKG